MIARYDRRRAIIANANVYSNAVTVNTARPTRRSQYDVGIGYSDDIEEARAAIIEAIATVSGIEAEPKPEVLVWELADSSVNLRVRWWTHSKRTDVIHARATVLETIKVALYKAGIDMSYPTQVMLFHDQSEETNRSRGEQREGWPRKSGQEPLRPVRDTRRAALKIGISEDNA